PGKEPDERPAPQRDGVANRPAQDRVAGFERVEERAHRDRALDLDLHLAVNARQCAQVMGEHHVYHGNVWTSTEYTAGRSRTMGLPVPPPSWERQTLPP